MEQFFIAKGREKKDILAQILRQLPAAGETKGQTNQRGIFLLKQGGYKCIPVQIGTPLCFCVVSLLEIRFHNQSANFMAKLELF